MTVTSLEEIVHKFHFGFKVVTILTHAENTCRSGFLKCSLKIQEHTPSTWEVEMIGSP